MSIQIEYILIVLSVLFFLSILAGKASSKFGVPALLLFLCVGMICGSDGLGIHFEDVHAAQTIGTIALCIILFSGGMDTKISEIKPVILQGVLLSTLGVLITACVSGLLIWIIFGLTMQSLEISLLLSFLTASIMASTDSAAVFSILRSKGLYLKNNLRPLLELESGSNDPMAYILVITIIDIIKMDVSPSILTVVFQLLLQLIIGALAGYFLGKLTVKVINKIHIGNDSLYPILVLTFCIFIFSLTYFIQGNGYLAIYIAGLVIGNSKFVHKRSSLRFFDGIAWMCQLLLFLTLGLLVNPHELIPIIIPGVIVSFVIIFLSRPFSVFLCLLPFRSMNIRDKIFVSWVGLRGAVPIVFAIIALAENIPHARIIFNIVFFCTLVSLLVQGTSIPFMAKFLRLAEKKHLQRKLREFDVEFADDIKSITAEIQITAANLQKGNKLMDLPLPLNTLVVMVKRNENYFIPKGNTILMPQDTLLIIADNTKDLSDTFKNLNIENSSLD